MNNPVARNTEEVVPNLVTGNQAPSELLKIPDETGDIPVQTEGVRNEPKDLDRNLNHPIEGKPVIPETRGVMEVNLGVETQENSTKKTVRFSDDPVPMISVLGETCTLMLLRRSPKMLLYQKVHQSELLSL